MKFMSIEGAIKKKKGNVSVRGWIYRERGSNKLKFIVLRDSTDIIQIVLKKETFTKQWKEIDALQIEAAVEIEGIIKQDKRAPTGFEIQASKIKIIGKSDNFPIQKNQSTEFLLDNRHLWIRSRKMSSIMKIRSTVFQAIREYFNNLGYYEFHSPTLSSVAESGQTLFEVKYYDKKIFLSQTWQFHAEAAMYGLEKIYTIAPSFRAEKSKTSRHLSEYWHAEVETAWMNLDELIDLGERTVKYVLKKVLEKNKQELKILKRDTAILKKYLLKEWPRITYDKALKLLKEKKNMKISWGKDLRTIEEEKLTQIYGVPVFVTHYPKEAMAFYKPRDPKNPKTARCFDLLVPEGWCELIGGSERDTNIEELKKSLKAIKVKLENYKWYLEINKYGSIPHAGFGLGVERLISWICGLDSIKDAIGFPRTMLRCTP
jgi:asparaginyl-tRNA synthetase